VRVMLVHSACDVGTYICGLPCSYYIFFSYSYACKFKLKKSVRINRSVLAFQP